MSNDEQFDKNIPEKLIKWYKKLKSDEKNKNITFKSELNSKVLYNIITDEKIINFFKLYNPKKKLIQNYQLEIGEQFFQLVFFINRIVSTNHTYHKDRIKKVHQIDNDIKKNISKLKNNLKNRIELIPKYSLDKKAFLKIQKHINLINDFLREKGEERDIRHVEIMNKKNSELTKITNGIFYELENISQKKISKIGIQAITLILSIVFKREINEETISKYYQRYRKNPNNKIKKEYYSYCMDLDINN